jgi:hypothetical protein
VLALAWASVQRRPDPVPALKRQLADKILELLEGWSNTWAAWDAHLSRSRISEMRRGNLDTFSPEPRAIFNGATAELLSPFRSVGLGRRS